MESFERAPILKSFVWMNRGSRLGAFDTLLLFGTMIVYVTIMPLVLFTLSVAMKLFGLAYESYVRLFNGWFRRFNWWTMYLRIKRLNEVCVFAWGSWYVVGADIDWLIVSWPRYELESKRYWRVENGDVVIDVGAHYGVYSLSSARHVAPNGIVVAIEPNPDSFAYLTKNIRKNNYENVIKPINAAAGDEEGDLQEFTYSLHTTTSRLVTNSERLRSRDQTLDSETTNGASRGDSRFQVPGVKLDSIVRALGLKRVDWIKIDVEGAELKVVKGALDTISRLRPNLLIEYHTLEIRRELCDFLLKLDYKLSYIREPGRARDNGQIFASLIQA